MTPARPALRHVVQTLTRLRALIQPSTTSVSKIDITYPPLFESVPPAKFRYAIPLAISIGAFTIGGCDMVLNHWSRLEEPSPQKQVVSRSSNDSPSTSSDSTSVEATWVLRPRWQRVSLAGAYVTMALSVGAIFFNQRARYVYRLHLIVPSGPSRGSGSVKGRSLFFQTCSHGRTQGHVVPLGHCKIMLAPKDWTVILLQAKGTPGVFRVGTAGAKIGGKDIPSSQVFAELAKCGIPSERLDMRKKKR